MQPLMTRRSAMTLSHLDLIKMTATQNIILPHFLSGCRLRFHGRNLSISFPHLLKEKFLLCRAHSHRLEVYHEPKKKVPLSPLFTRLASKTYGSRGLLYDKELFPHIL